MMCNLFEFKDMKMNFFIVRFMLRNTFSDVHQSMCKAVTLFCDTIYVNFSFYKFLDFSRGTFLRFWAVNVGWVTYYFKKLADKERTSVMYFDDNALFI